MVHCGSKTVSPQTRPPSCPKCGSHRTEIIGRTNDGDVVIVRCHACGERSRVDLDAASTIARYVEAEMQATA